MKREYDFTGAERGKFYRRPEQLELPVYLDKDVAKMLMRRGRHPRNLSAVVNRILRKEIEVIDILSK